MSELERHPACHPKRTPACHDPMELGMSEPLVAGCHPERTPTCHPERTPACHPERNLVVILSAAKDLPAHEARPFAALRVTGILSHCLCMPLFP